MTITLDNGMLAGSLDWPAICPVCGASHTVTYMDDSEVPSPLPSIVTACCGDFECATAMHLDSLAFTGEYE